MCIYIYIYIYIYYICRIRIGQLWNKILKQNNIALMSGYVTHLKQVMYATVIIIFATPCSWQILTWLKQKLLQLFTLSFFYCGTVYLKYSCVYNLLSACKLIGKKKFLNIMTMILRTWELLLCACVRICVYFSSCHWTVMDFWISGFVMQGRKQI